jgi:acetone carboxylase, gamma subunit
MAYDKETLRQLARGELNADELHVLQSAHKDAERFRAMLDIYQESLGWEDKVLLPYGDRLFIVERSDGQRVVKCACGHDFGDYRVNWKLAALVSVRDTPESMAEVFPPMLAADPDWMELREFYCPTCARQLEVEAVPPGYPIVFDFEPDLEGLDLWLKADEPAA